MTTKLENMKRTLNLMSRIMDNMTGDDFESMDAMRRAISDLSTEVFEFELDMQPACEEIAA